jgi:hypothetical protein
MKPIKENQKEIKLMDILSRKVQQFAECSEHEAILFVVSFMDAIKNNNIKIK